MVIEGEDFNALVPLPAVRRHIRPCQFYYHIYHLLVVVPRVQQPDCDCPERICNRTSGQVLYRPGVNGHLCDACTLIKKLEGFLITGCAPSALVLVLSNVFGDYLLQFERFACLGLLYFGEDSGGCLTGSEALNSKDNSDSDERIDCLGHAKIIIE